MENRIQKAAESYGKGKNCCQAVVCAFADLYGFSEEQAMKTGAGFGRGCGMEEMCGALCGTLMLLGMETGGTKLNKEAAEKFAARAGGGYLCKDIIGLVPCKKKVEEAARIFAEYLK